MLYALINGDSSEQTSNFESRGLTCRSWGCSTAVA